MNKLIATLSFIMFCPIVAFAQNAQTRTNYGSKQIFSYSVQATYGVNTSATATPGVKVQTEAVLNLKDGSFVTNKFGDDAGKASAVFTISPNGSSLDMAGITGENQLLLDDGTTFRASIEADNTSESPDALQDDEVMKAEATANAFHNSTVQVNKGEESFFNTFTQNFLDGL